MAAGSGVESLVAEFATSVAAQTEAIGLGEAVVGNRHAKRYITAFRRLREIGDSAREALSVLLSHERADVRVMAAAYLLRYKNEEATRVLRQESGGTGLAAFAAEQALLRWNEGEWSLDPAE